MSIERIIAYLQDDEPNEVVTPAMRNDIVWHAFIDYARQASVTVMLQDVAALMRGQRDPYYVPRQELYLDFYKLFGWSGLLDAIVAVQKEHEAAQRRMS